MLEYFIIISKASVGLSVYINQNQLTATATEKETSHSTLRTKDPLDKNPKP